MSAARDEGERDEGQRAASARAWNPSGIVSLTTDFGLVDPYVGMMKAVILARGRSLAIVDVTHGVPPQDVRRASFFLAAAWRYFPPGTVHVAVVDPGVGSSRALLVAHAEGHCFLAPDNGLLDDVVDAAARVFTLDVERFARPGASRTFHGRDILAPAAAEIALGLAPGQAGAARPGPFGGRARAPATQRTAAFEAQVVCVDHYGNLVLDARPEDLAGPLERWEIGLGTRSARFVATYAEGRPGEVVALVDSYGVLEIAVRDGNAAALLGLAPGDRVALRKLL
jgi:S-adenosylmethionine hydrolase